MAGGFHYHVDEVLKILLFFGTQLQLRNEDASFSLPPTLTEKAFKTR